MLPEGSLDPQWLRADGLVLAGCGPHLAACLARWKCEDWTRTSVCVCCWEQLDKVPGVSFRAVLPPGLRMV